MPSSNYQIWQQEDPQSNTDGLSLQELITYGVMAPSAHNTQPWKFESEDGGIIVAPNLARHLTVSDPTQRELYLSIGAAIENIVLAGSSLGLQVHVNYATRQAKTEVRLTETKIKASAQNWLPIIRQRRSNRSEFKPFSLPKELIEVITNAGGAAHVTLYTSSSDIELFAKYTAEASRISFHAKAFRKELSGWVRNNWTRQTDGMPGSTHNIPGAMSLLAHYIIPTFDLSNAQAKQDYAEMHSASAIALVCATKDDQEQWLEAGRALERAWLEVTKNGLAASVLASAIEVPAIRQKLRDDLKLDLYPMAVLRIGKPTKQYSHSPRPF